jgi:hypothetical protein
MEIPTLIDFNQTEKHLTTPEIRVWCHPHYIELSGDDYYEVFNSFAEAEDFIKTHPEAEEVPLIAFKGVEINIYEINQTNEITNQGVADTI